MTAVASTLPALSVVVITHQRPALCRAAVESVAAARRCYPGAVELIVVNSSPSRVFPEHSNVDVREVLASDARTAASKRDLAIALTSAEWIVFLDDDCQIVADSLRTMGDRIARADQSTVAFFGVTEFTGRQSGWLRAFADTDLLTDFSWASRREELPWAPTAFAAFRRSALLAVNGFDTTMRTGAGGEDVDLCLRLRQAGGRLKAIPMTLAYHDTQTWNSTRTNLRRGFNYGTGQSELIQRHRRYACLDVESPLLLVMPSAIPLLIASAAGARVGAIGLSLAVYAMVLFAADFADERRAWGKGLPGTLYLLAFRYAYRFGRTWSSVRAGGRGLLTGFDWNTVNGEAESNRWGQLPLRWKAAAVGTLLSTAVTLLGR